MFERPTTGSVVCPGCGRLTGVRDKRCFNCGRYNPGLWGFAPLLRRLAPGIGFTELVLGACATIYVLTLVVDPSSIGGRGLFSMLSPGRGPLFLFGASGAIPVFGLGRWWTVLSAAWLHGSLLHIVMNVLWLRQLMPTVSELYGPGRLMIIYTAASVTGFGATSVMGLLPFLGPFAGAGFTVGASAPLFGLFGALILYGQRTGSTAMGQEVWRWVIIFVVIGLIVPFIDNWAHLGGLAGGYATARLLDPLRDEQAGHVLAALVCLALSALAIAASLLHGVQFVR